MTWGGSSEKWVPFAIAAAAAAATSMGKVEEGMGGSVSMWFY